jgi:phosphohistidine phosphatase
MGKTIIIMRHAEAEGTSFSISDWERNLTKEGKNAAKRVGKLLKNQLQPDKILSSNSIRTHQTTEIVSLELGIDFSTVQLETELYLASSCVMQNAIHKITDEIESVLIIAHNPGVSDWIKSLTNQYVPMQPATAVIINLPISSWKHLTQGIGILEKIIS